MSAASNPVCAIMGSPVPADAKFHDYNGARFSFCCAGCDTKFAKDPIAALKNAETKKWVIGTSLFNPVSGMRLDTKAVKATSDYKGIRYVFATTAEKATFDKAPAKYAAMPTKDSLTCPVSKEKIGGYAGAFKFVDYKGTRYYICCGGCAPKFEANPAKFVGGIASTVGKPKVSDPAPGECKDEETH